MIRYSIEYHAEAQFEVTSELMYSRKQWGDQHALAYERELIHSLELLRTLPLLYPTQPQIDEEVRIKPFKGNRIVYMVEEENTRIIILAFLSIHRELSPEVIRKRKKNA